MVRTLRDLDNVIQSLATTPHLGPKCDHIRQGYRRMKAGIHLIYYRLDPAGDVDVVRILHGKMDPTLHLRFVH